MDRHPFDAEFRVTPEQKAQFQRDGFVKLKGFLNAAAVDAMHQRSANFEVNRVKSFQVGADSGFNRVNFRFEDEKAVIYELIGRPYFRRALTELTDRSLFLTNGVFFELEKNVDKGLPWHVGTQSFGFQAPEEFACSVWAPLHPIDPNGQGGGLACVPDHVISGEFVFQQTELAVVSTLESKERAGVRTNLAEYFELRDGILNSPTMCEIFDRHQVEYDFKPGDALLFTKMVVHRSIRLREGPMPRRAAYTMRFVDSDSHYDLQRAQNLEYPAKRYGKGLLPFKPKTRLHIEIAEAGARDGDRLAECAYFDSPDRRMVSFNGTRVSP